MSTVPEDSKDDCEQNEYCYSKETPLECSRGDSVFDLGPSGEHGRDAHRRLIAIVSCVGAIAFAVDAILEIGHRDGDGFIMSFLASAVFFALSLSIWHRAKSP